MKFEGIYTPVVTPYDDEFSVKRDDLAAVIDFLIDAGVHGLIIAGTTGEYYAQSMEERIELMGIARDMIKGRLPMIVGTGAMRTEDSITYARAAKAAGLRGSVLVEPGVGHGFMNPSRPDRYDAAAAERGWDRMLAFLRAELS